jgi:anti-sigma B factor antagonist
MALTIEETRSGEETMIDVRGEVDLYTSPQLRTAILKAVPKAGNGVAVDLSGVGYIDSSGVATLVEGLRSAKKHGKTFTLVAPSSSVMQVLELTRLDQVFEIRSTS